MKRFLSMALAIGMLLGVPMAAPLDGSAAYATQEQGYEPLQYGDQGEHVTAIQKQLSALGYYTGKISGNFLDGTRAAVTRFQKDYGLKETGVVDGQTEALLITAEYRVLGMGSTGDDVKRVQEHLSNLEYFEGKATGKFLEATTAAVKAFQERNHLEATGEADVATQKLLFSGKAVSKAIKPAGTPDPDADMGDINDVVMVEDGKDSDPSLEGTEYSRKLTRGAKGEEVKQVQQRLTDLGYFDGPISGNYMNKTMDAMRAFQTMNGLKADGIAGEDTWAVLFSATQALDASATPRPTPEPTPIPYAITVDVKNQVTTVYGRDEKGEYTVPVRRMVCSTGKVGTDSDLGEFVLDGRRARWCYFSLYGSHAQYWTRINKNIAFHSVIYNRVDYQAMSVKSYNMLGSRASHGCIRLLVSEAKWLYENIGEGVVVTIRDDLPADEELRHAMKPPPLNKEYMRPQNTPIPTLEPSYRADAKPPEPFRKLKKGSEGEDVYWLQRKLQDLGFYQGTATGSFYGGTQKAVKAYQKANGIYATGEADEKTLLALYADVLAAPAKTPAPEAAKEVDTTFWPRMTVTPEPSPEATPSLGPQATPSPELEATDGSKPSQEK